MLKNKFKYLACTTLLISMGMNVMANETVIEWAPFIKKSDITDKELISKASIVNSDFLMKQQGFIKRELIKKNENEYADIIYWLTKRDGLAASEKVNSCVVCGEYFELMSLGLKSGEGFSHYTIIESWNGSSE